jgi:hypothetical protein
MIILLKSGRALAFPKAGVAMCETHNDNAIVRLVLRTSKDVKGSIAEFNWDAVAAVITKDGDYADLLAAEWSRNLGRQTNDSGS